MGKPHDFKKRISLLLILTLFAANLLFWIQSLQALAITSGMVSYGEFQNSQYRLWDGTDFGPENSASVSGAAINYTVLKSSPERNEKVKGTLSDDGDIRMESWDGSSWTDHGFFTVDLNPGHSDKRAFDIEYEQISGDALIVYEINDIADQAVGYRIWNGTSWTSEAILTIPTAIGGVTRWIELEPKPGSDEIMLTTLDTNFNIYSIVWNGNSWVDGQLISSSASTNSEQSFDISWESVSGDALVVYGTSTTTEYWTYSGGVWSGPGIGSPNPGDVVFWLELASDPTSNYISFICIDRGDNVNAHVWDGAGWELGNPSGDPRATNKSGHLTDVAWESTTGRALFTYVDRNAWTVKYFFYTRGTGWSVSSIDTASAAPDFWVNDVETFQLIPSSYDNQIMLSGIDTNLNIRSVYWDGLASSWIQPANYHLGLGSSGTPQYRSESIMFAYDADIAAPDTTISDPTSGSILTGTGIYTVLGTSDDFGGSGVAGVDVAVIRDADGYYWNGTDWGMTEIWHAATGTTSWSYNWTLPTSDGGSYTIQARATDNTNNTDSSPATVSFFVDNVAPTVNSFAINSNAIYTNTTSVTLNSDVLGAAEMRFADSLAELALAAYVPYSSNYAYTLPPVDGVKTVYAQYKDAVGNETISGAAGTFDDIILDTIAPVTTLTTDPLSPDGAAGWFRTAPTISLTTNEPAVTYYQWDTTTGPWTTYTSPFKALEGTHTLYYYSQDTASNIETTQSTLFTVDTVDPSSSITDPSEGARIRGASYTISGTSSDTDSQVSLVEVSTDGGSTWNPATNTGTNFSTWEYSWTLPADGSYNLKSRAQDTAGNTETPSAGITVTVDNTPPTVTSTDPLEGQTEVAVSTTINATFSEEMDATSIDTSTFLLHDGVTYVTGTVTYDSPSTTATFSPSAALATDTTYTATVTTGVKDVAGNSMVSDKVWSFTTIDTIAPVTTLTTDPLSPDGAAGWFRTAPTISLTTNEPAVTYYQWDTTTGPWTTYTSPFKALEGTHTLYYYSQDTASNIETTQSTLFTVDTVDPSSSITDPSEGARIRGASYTISGTSSDTDSQVSLVEVSTDGGSTWNPATNTGTNFSTWEYSWTLPADGSYVIKSRATDNAGNIEDAGAGINVTIDNTPPAVVPHMGYTADPDMCALCHRSHTAVAPYQDRTAGKPGTLNLMLALQADSCYSCHDGMGSIYNVKNDFDARPSHHPIRDRYYTGEADHYQNCSDCHNPHGNKDISGQYYDRLLRVRDVQGDSIYEGNDFCGACHGSSTSGSGYKLGGDHITEYSGLAAHDVKVSEPFSGTGIKCSNCHEPHGSDFWRLNLAEEEDLCFLCHNSGSLPNTLNNWDIQGQFNMSSHHDITSSSGGKVECSSCHGPHVVKSVIGAVLSDPDNTKNLWSGNINSFCLKCHDGNAPAATVDPSTVIPYTVTFPSISAPFFPGWDQSDYLLIPAGMSSFNSCTTCHHPHGSDNNRLTALNYDNSATYAEEKLCLFCHKTGGPPGAPDVATPLAKTSKHPTDNVSGVHNDTEDSSNLGMADSKRHSECSDCHNPHTATSQTATAPANKGVNWGVGGIKQDGTSINPSINQYEICFKCHSDYVSRPPGQTDKRREFDPSNPSYHPVAALGKNTGISSVAFVSPWSETSQVYCTDCHNNEDPTGAQCPIGSANEHILKDSYTPTDTGLCFDCHTESVYTVPGTEGSRWVKHNITSGHAYCGDCHETHGNKQEHLINRGYIHYSDGGKIVTDEACAGSSCHAIGIWLRYYTAY